MSAANKIIKSIKEDFAVDIQEAHSSYLKLVEVFPLQNITNKTQHQIALKIIERIMRHFSETKEPRDRGIEIYLNTLSELAEDYEIKEISTPKVSGAEMLEYLMELKGLTQKDIMLELGGQSVVSNILNGKRELNLKQIKALAKKFKISPSAFI